LTTNPVSSCFESLHPVWISALRSISNGGFWELLLYRHDAVTGLAHMQRQDALQLHQAGLSGGLSAVENAARCTNDRFDGLHRSILRSLRMAGLGRKLPY
jgi:hypothetical protein